MAVCLNDRINFFLYFVVFFFLFKEGTCYLFCIVKYSKGSSVDLLNKLKTIMIHVFYLQIKVDISDGIYSQK